MPILTVEGLKENNDAGAYLLPHIGLDQALQSSHQFQVCSSFFFLE